MIPALLEEPPTDTTTTPVVDESVMSDVKKWLKRIEDAENHWEPKFKEMRKNMEFVAGFQWDAQTKLDDDRYISNITLRLVNQKVASLYARNPQVEVLTRDRMDYQIWDGKDVTQMAQAVEAVQMSLASGMMPPMEAMALIADYEQGRQQQKIVARIAETLQRAYQYETEHHRPEFKEQMKQLVRRVIICKVGYVKLTLCRQADPSYDYLSTTEVDSSVAARSARAQFIMDELSKGEVDETAPEIGEMKSLLTSLGATAQGLDVPELSEKLDFDFPSSTSIIPSKECRSLKEFVAATFVAQKYCVPKDLVEALFQIDNLTISTDSSENQTANSGIDFKPEELKDQKECKTVSLYEVFDSKTKNRFFVAKGYHDYVLAPEPVDPQISGFWPIFALTFNDIEGEEGTKAGIFPPSDVDLLRDVQKEWNRTRDALRDQRNANAPKYLVRSGVLSEEDKQNIQNSKPNSVIELVGLAPDVDPTKAVGILQTKAIDPAVYDTAPLEKDMMMAVGMQQANVGPAEADVTATVGTIAEQSRLSGVSSNVDDLDGLLTRLAKAGVEMILRGFSIETLRYTVGVGAAIPTNDLDAYLNSIQIKIIAASSGRPNKAMEVSFIQQLVPLLISAGANPNTIIREVVRRWDDQLDVDDFLPPLPTGMSMAAPPGGPQPEASGSPGGQKMLSPSQEKQGLISQPTVPTK